MNILIIGNSTENFCNLIKQSDLFDKLIIATSTPPSGVANIEYNDFDDLVNKIKSLQIDISIITDTKLIKNGLADFLKSKYINTISVNKKWFNLESSRLVAKELLKHYSINIPNIILAPKEFPIIIKTDSPDSSKIAYSMTDLVSAVKKLSGKKTFLEEFLDGPCYSLLTLWDGKSAYHIQGKTSFTEVQQDRLELLKTKFNIMFSDENANFIGFFSTKLIWAKNDWYVLEFNMGLCEQMIIERINQDFIYLLNTAIYQKINELDSNKTF